MKISKSQYFWRFWLNYNFGFKFTEMNYDFHALAENAFHVISHIIDFNTVIQLSSFRYIVEYYSEMPNIVDELSNHRYEFYSAVKDKRNFSWLLSLSEPDRTKRVNKILAKPCKYIYNKNGEIAIKTVTWDEEVYRELIFISDPEKVEEVSDSEAEMDCYFIQGYANVQSFIYDLNFPQISI